MPSAQRAVRIDNDVRNCYKSIEMVRLQLQPAIRRRHNIRRRRLGYKIRDRQKRSSIFEDEKQTSLFESPKMRSYAIETPIEDTNQSTSLPVRMGEPFHVIPVTPSPQPTTEPMKSEPIHMGPEPPLPQSTFNAALKKYCSDAPGSTSASRLRKTPSIRPKPRLSWHPGSENAGPRSYVETEHSPPILANVIKVEKQDDKVNTFAPISKL